MVRGNFTTGASTTQNYQDFFVQDTWRVGSRLTVNPGLRFEQETLNGNAISGFSLGNNWAPRIGATFDPNGDGKTKIYGNWGRFYSRVPNDLAARALSAETGISLADYFDVGLTTPIPQRRRGRSDAWNDDTLHHQRRHRGRHDRSQREDVLHQRVHLRCRA